VFSMLGEPSDVFSFYVLICYCTVILFLQIYKNHQIILSSCGFIISVCFIIT